MENPVGSGATDCTSVTIFFRRGYHPTDRDHEATVLNALSSVVLKKEARDGEQAHTSSHPSIKVIATRGSDSPRTATVLWSNTFLPGLVKQLPQGAVCNRFPQTFELTHKHRLCVVLRTEEAERKEKSKKGTEQPLQLHPLTFLLPQEADVWEAAAAAASVVPASPSCWVVKPVQVGRGVGVRLIDSSAVPEENRRLQKPVSQADDAQSQVATHTKPTTAEQNNDKKKVKGDTQPKDWKPKPKDDLWRVGLRKQKKCNRAGNSTEQGDGEGELDVSTAALPSSATTTTHIAQLYIPNPLLIRGFKVDLRLYVLVTSFSTETGPSIFLFREGAVRFASAPYSTEKSSQTNPFVHLTNNCVNARNVLGGDGAPPVGADGAPLESKQERRRRRKLEKESAAEAAGRGNNLSAASLQGDDDDAGTTARPAKNWSFAQLARLLNSRKEEESNNNSQDDLGLGQQHRGKRDRPISGASDDHQDDDQDVTRFQTLWSRMGQLVLRTFTAVAPLVDAATKAAILEAPQLEQQQPDEGTQSSSSSSSSSSFFELFGVDVLVDSEVRPWLLEVNSRPTLSGSLEQPGLLQEVFRIVAVSAGPTSLLGQVVDHGDVNRATLTATSVAGEPMLPCAKFQKL